MKEVKLIIDFNNLKKGLTFNIPNGLTILTGVNGSGKTNLLKYLSWHWKSHDYMEGEVSFIDISHITSVVNDNSGYSSSKTLYMGREQTVSKNYIKEFLDYTSKLNLSEQSELISGFKLSKRAIKAEIRVVFLEFCEYLEYLNKIGANIRNQSELENQCNYEKFLMSGKASNAVATPVNLMFIEACLSYKEYRKEILDKEVQESDSTQTKENIIKAVDSHLEKLFGTATSPWDTLNAAFIKYGFKNRLIQPIARDQYSLAFENIDTQAKIGFNQLSTGEKIIVLVMTFILYENRTVKLLLIDELDAYLNPKMSEMLINILKDFVIDKNKIDVIMTTHNPITVNCLDAEKDTIYWLDNGEIQESTKYEVLQLLTPGMFTFNNKAVETIFNISGKECFIFTEGHTDAIHIECAIRKLKPELLNKLHFMDCGKGKTSAQIIKEILEKLALIQNLKIPKIIGIFDKDADGKRYYDSLKSSKMGAPFRDNSNCLKCKEFYAILLNPSNQNQHNESYAPIELMYGTSFLVKYDVIELISNPSEKQRIQNCYIKGEDIFKKSIDTEKTPFDVYLVNDSHKDTFANMIKNNLNTLNVSDFSGFQDLIDTIEQICNS